MTDNAPIKKRVFNITIHLNEEEYIRIIKQAEKERRKPAELARLILIDNL